MLVTKDEAVEMASAAQKKLRAFDMDAATKEEQVTFVSAMEDEARSQATNLRETLAFLVSSGEGQSDYAQALRRMLPQLDLILCKMTDIDIRLDNLGGSS
jgi:predicted GTPase